MRHVSERSRVNRQADFVHMCVYVYGNSVRDCGEPFSILDYDTISSSLLLLSIQWPREWTNRVYCLFFIIGYRPCTDSNVVLREMRWLITTPEGGPFYCAPVEPSFSAHGAGDAIKPIRTLLTGRAWPASVCLPCRSDPHIASPNLRFWSYHWLHDSSLFSSGATRDKDPVDGLWTEFEILGE